jgi:hypothetical protein
VTEAVPKPVQKDNEKEEFASCMEEWDSIHYKILSWFINTFIPSINSLLPKQTNPLWEQLSAANSKLDCSKNIQMFATWLDQRKFMHFMMALQDDFESTRAYLLHRQPLPTLDAAFSELICEETRRSTMKMQSFDMVLATASCGTSQSSTGHPSSQSTSKTGFCKWCKRNGHTINECRKFQYYM